MSKLGKFVQYTTMAIGAASVFAAMLKPIIESTATTKDDAVLSKVNTGLELANTIVNSLALNPKN